MADDLKPMVCPKCGGELMIDYPIKGRASAVVLGILPNGDMAIEGQEFDAQPSSYTSDVYCGDRECGYTGTSRRNRYTLRGI